MTIPAVFLRHLHRGVLLLVPSNTPRCSLLSQAEAVHPVDYVGESRGATAIAYSMDIWCPRYIHKLIRGMHESGFILMACVVRNEASILEGAEATLCTITSPPLPGITP